MLSFACHQEKPSTESFSPRTWVKPAVFACLTLLVVVASILVGGEAGLAAFEPWANLEVLVQENLALSLTVYFLCTVMGCTVLVLPGLVFALAAGALFGPYLGTIACVAAATVGAVLSFLIGRFFLRDAVRPRALRNAAIRRWLFGETGVNAVVLLAITRLVPLFPYNLQNFAYGVTDMKVTTYAAFSFLFMIPGTAMYVLAGAGVSQGASGLWCLALAVGIGVAVIGAAVVLKRRFGLEDEVPIDDEDREVKS